MRRGSPSAGSPFDIQARMRRLAGCGGIVVAIPSLCSSLARRQMPPYCVQCIIIRYVLCRWYLWNPHSSMGSTWIPTNYLCTSWCAGRMRLVSPRLAHAFSICWASVHLSCMYRNLKAVGRRYLEAWTWNGYNFLRRLVTIYFDTTISVCDRETVAFFFGFPKGNDTLCEECCACGH